MGLDLEILHAHRCVCEYREKMDGIITFDEIVQFVKTWHYANGQ
jgi:hypothetical protein